MTASWQNVVSGLRERTEAVRRCWKRFTSENRTVLAVTRDNRCQMSLRVLALEQGWRFLLADSAEEAARLYDGNRACVLVYDRELPGTEWRNGLRRVLNSQQAMLPVVIASAPDERLRSEVLSYGGYDVARKPIEAANFASLVNGALALADSIDWMEP